jgi:IS1 family transposase
MNRLSTTDRAQVVSMLCEGMGIRPIVRATGVAKNTIQKLVREVGAACIRLHDDKVRNLKCGRIEADELWAFIGARQKRVKPGMPASWGDVWLWSAVCVESKIVPAWCFGPRTKESAAFMWCELFARIDGRFEVNTDGFTKYAAGLRLARYQYAGREVDWAMVIKTFCTPNGMWNDRDNKYEQPQVKSIRKERRWGSPDTETASTSHIEALNARTRVHNKKLSRLTNGQAKRLTMLDYTQAIAFTYHNFCKRHPALGGAATPCMAQAITDRPWTVADLVGLIEAPEVTPAN